MDYGNTNRLSWEWSDFFDRFDTRGRDELVTASGVGGLRVRAHLRDPVRSSHGRYDATKWPTNAWPITNRVEWRNFERGTLPRVLRASRRGLHMRYRRFARNPDEGRTKKTVTTSSSLGLPSVDLCSSRRFLIWSFFRAAISNSGSPCVATTPTAFAPSAYLTQAKEQREGGRKTEDERENGRPK